MNIDIREILNKGERMTINTSGKSVPIQTLVIEVKESKATVNIIPTKDNECGYDSNKFYEIKAMDGFDYSIVEISGGDKVEE